MIHDMCLPKHSVEECNLCGSCAEICPFDAITVDSEWRYDSATCIGCSECVPACTTGALSYAVMDIQKGLALAAKACI